ncbi:ankyrin repeat domain-containing protein [Anatilimnocola floriformis]|uniref:ankyrin repeat domain-containing protein n=1 Tax=Anatilimnocola floriformis TaxID=2948575 RepID=UPI0020C46308|nr:ankyrin repeat domain-containing protein [Anatilimnocola floriformis]
MFRSCFLALLLYAAIAVGYWFWLDKVFDRPGSYWGAAGLGFVVFCCIGALMNAWTAWKDWTLASAARGHSPPRDGRLMAACGPIQPVGQPLLAPFSNAPCCLVEYDLSTQSKSTSTDDDTKTGSDLAGFLMTPSEIQTGAGNIRLLGFPILEETASYTLGSFTAARRARDFVSRTQFEDISGLRLVNVFSAIQDAWADEDGHVEKNLQLKKVNPQALFPDDLEAVWQEMYGEQAVEDPGAEIGKIEEELDEEEEDDEDFEDDDLDDNSPPLPYIPIPTLKENRIAPGEQVCVIGKYDEMRRGIRPSGFGMQGMRLIRGSIDTLEKKASASLWGNLLGGIFFLIVAHAATYFVMWAYLHNNPKLVQKRTQAAFTAAEKGEVPPLEELFKRGVDVNLRDDQGRTLLMWTHNLETAAWLIEQKIDIDAVEKHGNTALNFAAAQGHLDKAKLLIDSKAKLNLRNEQGHTALNSADSYGNADIAALLRAAGAEDDVITEKTGEPIAADGPQAAVVKKYVQAIFDKDAAALAATQVKAADYAIEDQWWKGWQDNVFTPFEKVEGFARGDSAVVTVYGKATKFDNAPAKITFQLRRSGNEWKVADKRLDIN